MALLDPESVRPAGRPPAAASVRGAAESTAPLTRTPDPIDLLAMQAEVAPAEFVFRTPDGLGAEAASWGVVVVDRAGELTDADAAAVRAVRDGGAGSPLLLVVDRADAERRAALIARFGLVDPVWVGGGWDPGSALEAEVVATQQAVRSAVKRVILDRGPAVAVAPSRVRAERLVTGLERSGLRSALWAPPRCAPHGRPPPWLPGEPCGWTPSS